MLVVSLKLLNSIVYMHIHEYLFQNCLIMLNLLDLLPELMY